MPSNLSEQDINNFIQIIKDKLAQLSNIPPAKNEIDQKINTIKEEYF